MPQFRRIAARRVALLAFVSLAAAGCSESTAIELGNAIVTVLDANNVPVAGFPVTLIRASDGTPWRALYTSANGSGEFGAADGGVLPGTYLVHADLHLVTHTLGPGETNDKPMTVVAGQATTVTFKIIRGGGGQTS